MCAGRRIVGCGIRRGSEVCVCVILSLCTIVIAFLCVLFCWVFSGCRCVFYWHSQMCTTNGNRYHELAVVNADEFQAFNNGRYSDTMMMENNDN